MSQIKHLKTGYDSPQYHVLLNNLFQTMFRKGEDNVVIDTICNILWGSNHHIYMDDQYIYTRELIY